MAKEKVVLTESKLRDIIRENIRDILNEVSFPKMYGAYNGFKEKEKEYHQKYREAKRQGNNELAQEYQKLWYKYANKSNSIMQSFKSMYNGVDKDGIQQTFGTGNDETYTLSTKETGDDSITGNRTTTRSLTNSGNKRTDLTYNDDYRTSSEQYQSKPGDVLARERRRTSYDDGTANTSASKYQVEPDHDNKLRYDKNFWPWKDDEYNGEFETTEFDKLKDKDERVRQWMRGERDSSEFRIPKDRK